MALTASSAVALPAAGAGSSTFSDVPVGHPYFDEVEWAAGEGVITGFGDATFRPAAEVSRQAVAAFLYRFAGADDAPPTPPSTPTFRDVASDHPFFAEIEWASAAGLTTGFGDGTFRPSGPVTRQSMAAYLYRVAGSPTPPPDLQPVFTDVRRTHPFFVPIAFVYDFGIAGGYRDGTFRSTVRVTRAVTAAFLQRLDQVADEPLAADGVLSADALPPWPDRVR